MSTGRSFSKLGANFADLDIAWQDRLEDANCLRAAGRFPTSVTMGLYALEIFLKSRICRRLDLDALHSAFEIHDLEGLLTLSGLRRRLIRSPAVDNWANVLKMSKKPNDLRYGPNLILTETLTEEFFEQLNGPLDGVITWISLQP